MADQSHNAVRYFDAYEIIGVITPGVVVALLLSMEWPSFRTMLGEKGLSIGDFGLFILVAFVLGHLIQAVGNMLEPIIWFPFGLPTNWVRGTNQNLVTPEQRKALEKAVAGMQGTAQDISRITRHQWLAVTTRAYGRLKMTGRSSRVDTANRAYGLNRGLSAALLACLAWYAVAHRPDYTALVILGVAVCAAVWRTRRTGIHYARVLVLEFIDSPVAIVAPRTVDGSDEKPNISGGVRIARTGHGTGGGK